MIIRLPTQIKRFQLHSSAVFCAHHSPNQTNSSSEINRTLEYLLIDMTHFPFTTQNDCQQKYASCLLMTIIDLIRSMTALKRVCFITNTEGFMNLLDVDEWRKLVCSFFKPEQVTLRVLGGGLDKNLIMKMVSEIQNLFEQTMKFRMISV
ncbi:unnamed protein product [Adineta steineri]|uniref:Uncharacterized protein n=2 Tax=Adineta steineri TaxID=433720 RepID=A0A819YXW4_9BILA|nr:unnamed protein product [Adineta steineri]CAF4155377.1 unnamed protein product [Adineta steineri]